MARALYSLSRPTRFCKWICWKNFVKFITLHRNNSHNFDAKLREFHCILENSDAFILKIAIVFCFVENNLKLKHFFWMMTFLGHTDEVKVRRRCSPTRSESALFTACPRICRHFDALLSAKVSINIEITL